MPPVFPVRLHWPAVRHAVAYRFVAKGLLSDELVTVRTTEPELLFEAPPAAGAEWPEWRVQFAGDDGAWVDYLPYMEWPRAHEGPVIALHCPQDGASVHRMVVYDEALREVVIKAATLELEYQLDRSRLDPSHSYRWRVQRWEDGRWADGAAYEPLSVQPELGGAEPARPASPPDRGADSGELLFLFTSDTEVHLRWMAQPNGAQGIQEHIFGSMNGESVGVGRQMAMLEEHGYKGTFFVDILAELQFGEGSLQPVFDEILGRGHDAQLHLHPSPHLRFAKDERIRALSFATLRDDPAMFRAAMEVAIELFERRAGTLPVAYRAGAYRIFSSHFPVLRELGILVDSSVNPFKNCNVPLWLAARTQPAWVEGVLEVPISWHLHNDGRRWRAEQFAPVTSPTAQRAAAAAMPAAAGGPSTTLCYIAHSYSFLGRTRIEDKAAWADWNGRWEQLMGKEERDISGYNVGAALIQLDHVDHRRIDTFGEFLSELSRRPSVAGISLAELAERRHEWDRPLPGADPVPAYDGRGRRPTATSTRRYSESYLELLESARAS